MIRVAHVLDNRAQGLDEEGGRWSAVCRSHGALLSADTRRAAQDDVDLANAAGYCEWCGECNEHNDERKAAA